MGVGVLWGWGCCGVRLLWDEVAVGYNAALTYFFCTYVYACMSGSQMHETCVDI